MVAALFTFSVLPVIVNRLLSVLPVPDTNVYVKEPESTSVALSVPTVPLLPSDWPMLPEVSEISVGASLTACTVT